MVDVGNVEIRIAGAVPVRDPGPDDPPYNIVLHRDVGGPYLRERHDVNNPKCWCAPLVVNPDLDPRREVYRQQFEGLKRLN
jgi:hypothetical protein